MAEPLVVIDDVPVDPTPRTTVKIDSFNGSDTPPVPVPIPVPIPVTVPVPTPTATDLPAEDLWTKETGWKNVDEAKAAKAKLAELEKLPKPEAFKFANEASEKAFNALKEGKEDDVFNYLQTKRQIERAEKLDANKPKEATEIIKLDLKYKNKDLEPEDVDYLFEKRYGTPEKPVQELDQSDADYEKQVAKWEKQVKSAEKGLIVDAKMAKPDLAKYKTEIILPEIPKVAPTPAAAGPSQEELAAYTQARESYLQLLEKGSKEFKGYSIKAKDEEVELPISYEVTDPERKSYKESLQEFNTDEYFEKRWFDKDQTTGALTPKVIQMMDDKYLLENRDKIFLKIANEAAAKMKDHMIKTKVNLNISGTPNNTVIQQPQKTSKESEVEYLWKNG